MTIREMRIFKSVFETHSMTQTAKKLYISQPAVSKTIADIESKLQISLFLRESKDLQPTENAIYLYEKICNILKEVDTLSKLEENKQIHLATSITLANTNLFKVLNTYKSLNVSVVNADDVIDNILNNSVDFGVVEGTYKHPELNFELIRYITLNFFVAKHSDLDVDSINDLLQEKILLREQGSSIRIAFDSLLKSRALDYTPTFISVNSEAILNTILNLDYNAVGLLPIDLINTDQFKILTLKDIHLKTPVQLVYRKDKYINQEHLDILEFLKNNI